VILRETKIMKKIFILLFCLSTQVYATYPIIKVDSIEGTYTGKEGKAFAQSASYDLKDVFISHKQIEVNFFKPDQNLVIKDNSTQVKLNFDFSFMDIFENFMFDGMFINAEAYKFKINSENLIFRIQNQDYALIQAKLASTIDKDNQDLKKDFSVLEGLTYDSSLLVEKLDMGQLSFSEFQELLEVQDLPIPDNKMAKIPFKVKNIDIDIKKNYFKGYAFVDSWINAGVYLNGTIVLNHKKDKLLITLHRAKYGYFSIKRIILNRVRNLNLNNVKVIGEQIVVDV